MENVEHAHLDSDALLKAVVSESDLPRDLRAHLKQCPACRREVDRLAARFGAIGRMARDISPDALGRVRLPEKRRRFLFGRRVGLRPALGMAVAMALFMLMALYQPFGHRFKPTEPAPVQRAEILLSPEAEAELFAEIQNLLRDPLPDDYRQLAGGDSLFGEPGDPTDYIVPDVDLDAGEELGATRHLKGTA